MRPSELLKSDLFDLLFDLECCRQADADSRRRIEQINASKGMVFPVVDIGG